MDKAKHHSHSSSKDSGRPYGSNGENAYVTPPASATPGRSFDNQAQNDSSRMSIDSPGKYLCFLFFFFFLLVFDFWALATYIIRYFIVFSWRFTRPSFRPTFIIHDTWLWKARKPLLPLQSCIFAINRDTGESIQSPYPSHGSTFPSLVWKRHEQQPVSRAYYV